MKINKTTLLIAGGVLIVAAVGTVLIARSSSVRMPNPKTASQKDLNLYLASDSFGNLPDDQKVAYLDKVRKESPYPPGPPQGLTPEQMGKVMKNTGVVFRRMMDKQVEEFCNLPPEKRDAYLDQMIDRFEAMRKAGPRPFGGGPGPGAGPGGTSKGGPAVNGPPRNGPPRGFGPPPPAAMRRMIDSVDPKKRAMMAQFFEAMQKRMKERGIKGPGNP